MDLTINADIVLSLAVAHNLQVSHLQEERHLSTK